MGKMSKMSMVMMTRVVIMKMMMMAMMTHYPITTSLCEQPKDAKDEFKQA